MWTNTRAHTSSRWEDTLNVSTGDTSEKERKDKRVESSVDVECNVITCVSLLARRLILLHWKQATAPAHARMREVMTFRFRENKILMKKTGRRFYNM